MFHYQVIKQDTKIKEIMKIRSSRRMLKDYLFKTTTNLQGNGQERWRNSE